MSSIAVVGAGVFGAWTALRLAEAGHRVTLIDAYGPANPRASSSDHSRVIRAGYGADVVYSQWASASRRDWEWLSAECGQTLLTTTGALFMGEPANAYVHTSRDTLAALGLAAEWLEPAEIAARFPAIATDGLGPALFECDAGVLRARLGVQAVVDIATRRAGVVYRTGFIKPLDEARATPVVNMMDGAALGSDLYVMAGGPWLPQLLPQAIGDRIRSTRQEVLYFGVPPGDVRYSVPHLPVWIDFAAGVYGIPDIDARGFKIGIDRHGTPIDPNTADRVVDAALVETTRQFLARRFPGLRTAPLVDARVCQYQNTSTGDFIVDQHPAWPNVWIAGGGSGHGFKHGPAIARHVVDLIEGRVRPDPRFSLASKTTTPQRAVF